MIPSGHQRAFRKNDKVFWVLVQDEIVLRNYATNVAVQLGSDQRRVWELLDGAHTGDQIVQHLSGDASVKIRANEIFDLIATLEAGGFLFAS